MYSLSVDYLSLTMEEVILRFSHLKEQIFEKLDNPSLTKCRVVSNSWKHAIENLKDLPLDLDDDLFFYSHDNHHHSNNINKKDDNNLGEDFISIWEFYEIHPSRPRKLKPYGQWNSSAEKQLSLTKESKWNRRRDLEVSNENILKIPENDWPFTIFRE